LVVAESNHALAIGSQTQAIGEKTVAIGHLSKATGSESTALGVNAEAKGNGDIALGKHAVAQGGANGITGSAAVGDEAKATGAQSAAVGGKAKASGTHALASGYNTQATGGSSSAIGDAAEASGNQATAVGVSSEAKGDQSAALGMQAHAHGSGSVAAGVASKAMQAGTTAIGGWTEAIAEKATAVGDSAKAKNNQATALGHDAQATGEFSTATGVSSRASGSASVATGKNATASGDNAIATGNASNAAGADSIASGRQASATGTGAIATGAEASASGNAAAYGYKAKATGGWSSAFGNESTATATDASAFGNSANAGGVNSTAIGSHSTVTANNGSALGNYASVSAEGGVALGKGSSSSRTALNADNVHISDAGTITSSTGISDNDIKNNKNHDVYAPVKLINDPSTLERVKNTIKGTAGAVSLGNDTTTRQLTNLAPGSADSDAVNVAQLKAVVGTIKHYNVTSKDGDITVNPDTTDPNNTVWDLKINPKYKIKYFSVKSEGGANENNDGATATDAIAIGKDAASSANNAVVIGKSATALKNNERYDLNVGTATSNADSAVVIGNSATSKQARTVAIGNEAQTLHTSAIAIGDKAYSNGARGIAIGRNAQSTGNNSIALGASDQNNGNKTTADKEHAVAIGSGAAANIANGIALGSESKTTVASGQTGFDASQEAEGVRKNKYNGLTGKNLTSNLAGLSIGNDKKTRQINHLAAGTADDDAVNVAQLKSVNLAFKGDNNTKGDVRLHDQRLSVVGAADSFITTKASDKKLEISTTQGTFSTTDGKSSSTKPGLATTTAVASAINDSGWEVLAKGTKVGLVNPGDKVDFTNADKSIEIESFPEANGLSTIKFKAVTAKINTEKKHPVEITVNNGITTQKIDNTKQATPTGRFVVPTGDDTNKYALATAYDVADKVNQTGWNLYTNGGAPALINPGDYVNFKSGNATNANVVTEASEGATISYDVNVDNTTIKIDPNGNQLTANTVDLTVNKTGDNAGKVETPADADKGKLVTSENVAKAINESYWVAKRGDSVTTNEDSGDGDSNVAAGNNVTFVAGKNMALQKSGNKFIYATKDDVEFTNVTTTNTTTTNLTVKNGGNVDMGNNKVKNVADGNVTSDSKEAVNGSQLYTVDNKFNNTVTLGGENNSATDAQKLNKDGGLKFNIVGAENGNITTTASGTDVKIDLTQGTKDDIKKGVDANTTVTTKGLTFNGNTGNTGIKKLGSEVDVKGGTTNNVITTTANDKGIAINYNGTEAAKVTNLSYKANNGDVKKVTLEKGLNFTNGTHTTAEVSDNGVVKFNVNTATVTVPPAQPDTFTGKFEAPNNDGVATIKNVVDVVNNSGWKISQGAESKGIVKAGDEVSFVGAGGTTVTVDGTSGKRTVTVSSTLGAGEKGEIIAVTKDNKAGTEKVGQVKPQSNKDDSKVTTVKNVADMINSAKWFAKADNSEDDLAETKNDDGEAVNAGSELTFKAGKNLHVNRTNGVFTFALDSVLKDLTSTTYKNGDNTVTVSADVNGDLHISKPKAGSTTNETVDAKITGVAEGTKDNDAVNVKQLRSTELHIAPTKANGKDSDVTYTYDDETKSVTLKYKDGNGNVVENTEAKIDLSGLANKIKDYSFKTNATGSNLVGTVTDTTVESGKSVNFAASDNLTLKQDVNDGNVTYTYGLKNQVVVGEKGTPGADGKPGKDGVDGSIGVNGKDGSAVAINGNDGSIGLNGKDGENGLTIKGDKGAVGVDGTNGKDGKDGMTRIVYTDNNQVKHEVATLDDGQKYAGDNYVAAKDNQAESNVIAKKANERLDIVGGAKGNLTEGNIGVNAKDGKLHVQLAEKVNLGNKGSVTIGDTVVNNNGITIKTVSLTNQGLNNGGNKITHVAEGKDDTDAVNVKQLKDFKSEVAEGGLTFAGNSGTAHKAKLNTTVNIKGGKDNTDATKFDNGKNVMTAVNGDTVTVSIKKTPEVEGINITDTTGNVKVKLTQTDEGLKVSDGNNNATRITNVKAGEKDTDAVNVKQLKAAKTEVEAGENIEVTSRTDTTNGQTIYKVSAKGINDTSAAVKGGSDHVKVTKAANTHKDGSTTVTDYTVDLSNKTKEDIKKGVDAHTEVTTKGLTFNADKGTTGVKKLGSKVSVNGDGKNITTTADENGVKVSMKDDIKVNSVTAKEVKVGDVNINENGINAGGKRITHVAPGKDGTDAVNVNQLKYVAGNISNQINNVDKGLRAGIAGALASGGLYHATTSGKSMVSVGAGTYRGQNALAVGYSRLSDNGKVGVKFTVNSNSQGHAGASASVGYQW
jgi:autotransporter adhesin